MKIIYNKIFLTHDTGDHPENKSRLEAFGKLPETDLADGEKYLKFVHKEDYIQNVKDACQSRINLDPDTVAGPGSFEAAKAAVSATILACQRGDFALVRPPGHHAHPHHSSGFCIFNNMAIACARLEKEGKKVFIFDFDGHLGDGTEKFFYSTNRVFYWSLHQFPAFPGGGSIEEIGDGEGRGYTLNIPILPQTADDVYLKAVNQFMPLVLQFCPDIVGVSAGFDGHKDDFLLNLRLSTNLYYELGELLGKNFKNIFAVLEGGYNTQILPPCLFNFIDGINGKPQRFKDKPTESPALVKRDYEEKANRLKELLSPFWDIKYF